MPSGSSSQRGASRSGRKTSTSRKTSAGGSATRTRSSAATSSSPRKSRTPSKPRGTTGAARGVRRSPSRTAPRRGEGWLVPAAVVGAILLLVWSMYPALKVQYETSRRLAGLQAEYKGLSAKNKALRAEVADLKTPEGVEKAARENLGLARPGENVYVVMPSGTPTGSASAAGPGKRASDSKDVVTAFLDAVFGVR